MFLLVSVRHVGAHPGEHQHGVSIQISISLPGYLVCKIFLWPDSWRGSLYMYLLSFPEFWTLSVERFWFLFWSIWNGVMLKTSNTVTKMYAILFYRTQTWYHFWNLLWNSLVDALSLFLQWFIVVVFPRLVLIQFLRTNPLVMKLRRPFVLVDLYFLLKLLWISSWLERLKSLQILTSLNIILKGRRLFQELQH